MHSLSTSPQNAAAPTSVSFACALPNARCGACGAEATRQVPLLARSVALFIAGVLLLGLLTLRGRGAT